MSLPNLYVLPDCSDGINCRPPLSWTPGDISAPLLLFSSYKLTWWTSTLCPSSWTLRDRSLFYPTDTLLSKLHPWFAPQQLHSYWVECFEFHSLPLQTGSQVLKTASSWYHLVNNQDWFFWLHFLSQHPRNLPCTLCTWDNTLWCSPCSSLWSIWTNLQLPSLEKLVFHSRWMLSSTLWSLILSPCSTVTSLPS